MGELAGKGEFVVGAVRFGERDGQGEAGLGEEGEEAEAVGFLVSDHASQISGTALEIPGGTDFEVRVHAT